MPDLTTTERSESPVPADAGVSTPSLGGSRALSLSRLAGVLVLYLAVALLYWPSSLELDALWRNMAEETYTHGYLILLISVWLIVRNRARLAAATGRPVPGALVALAIMSTLWLWAWRSAIQEVQLLLLPLLLLTTIVAAFGWRIGRLMAFPVGYLYFAIPLWGYINPIVRDLSSWMTGVLIWITGLPAFMQGNYVNLPGGTIEIANSCSGLHALIVGLALSALYGEMGRDTVRRRIEWLAVMGGLALAVNWVRIFIVVAAAYATDMRSSLVKNHYWLGWWLFAGVFVAFLWWAGRRDSSSPAGEGAGRTDEPAAPAIHTRLRLAPMVLALGALAVLPVLSYGMDLAHPATSVVIRWPQAPKGWQGPQPAASADWRPHFINPSGESFQVYIDAAGHSVEAFAVAYRTQNQRGKLLGYGNNLLGADHRWRAMATRIVSSPTGHWRETLTVDSAGARALIWSRYRIGSRYFVRARLSQLWYGLQALVSPPLSSLTALRSTCTPNCRSARSRLRSAAATLRPTLQ